MNNSKIILVRVNNDDNTLLLLFQLLLLQALFFFFFFFVPNALTTAQKLMRFAVQNVKLDIFRNTLVSFTKKKLT